MGTLCLFDIMDATIIMAGTFVFESITTIYNHAQNSLSPSLIHKDNYSKAYSVTSVIQNLTEAAALLGILGYNYLGPVPVLFLSSACFFVAAIVETRIKLPKGAATAQNTEIASGIGVKAYIKNYKVVFNMIKNTTGFTQVVICDMVDCFRTGALWALVLPYLESYYKGNSIFGFTIPEDYVYIVVLAFYSVGQFWSGILSYKLNLKGTVRAKYLFIFSIVETVSIALFPFFNIVGSIIVMAIAGAASILTNCAYDTVMADRVPKDMRARFQGVIEGASALMLILGNLAGGFMIDHFKHIQFGFLITGIPELIIIIIMAVMFFRKIVDLFDCESIEEDEEDWF